MLVFEGEDSKGNFKANRFVSTLAILLVPQCQTGIKPSHGQQIAKIEPNEPLKHNQNRINTQQSPLLVSQKQAISTSKYRNLYIFAMLRL